MRLRERASASRSRRVLDPRSPDGEVDEAEAGADEDGAAIGTAAAVGAGGADFWPLAATGVAVFLVVFRVEAGALRVTDFEVPRRVAVVALVAGFFVALVCVEGAVLVADFLADDFRAGFWADVEAVLEVAARAGDFVAAVFSATSADGSASRATLPGTSATNFACFANRLAAFCVCFAADSATVTASSRRRSSCLIRLSAVVIGSAVTTGLFLVDAFALATGAFLLFDFVLALAMVPPRERE